MDSQQRAHVALNLSYVLHERSESKTVERHVHSREVERRRCTKAIRELATLPEAELGNRLVVVDQTDNPGAPEAKRRIVSVNVGAIELLPRLLYIAGHPPAATETTVDLLDAPQLREERSLTFFGVPAALNAPASPSESAIRPLFATAVLRPGYASIQIRITPLHVEAETGDPDWNQAVRLAEEIIREFPLQWWCDRPLWPRPVEDTLPEFRSTGNGAISCGH